jgi:hypothetical protein
VVEVVDVVRCEDEDQKTGHTNGKCQKQALHLAQIRVDSPRHGVELENVNSLVFGGSKWHHSSVAERAPRKRKVLGSIPSGAFHFVPFFFFHFSSSLLFVLHYNFLHSSSLQQQRRTTTKKNNKTNF